MYDFNTLPASSGSATIWDVPRPRQAILYEPYRFVAPSDGEMSTPPVGLRPTLLFTVLYPLISRQVLRVKLNYDDFSIILIFSNKYALQKSYESHIAIN